MEKELIHKDCGGEIEMTMDDNNACGDPECCGDYKENPVLTCKKCGKHEKIY